MLLSLPFLGSDCEDIINQINNTGDITGEWTLIYNSGSTNDICPGETANFQSNGIATLTCPFQSPVDRNYTYTSNTLTYTASGMAYTVAFDGDQVQLSGTNNNRNLFYTRGIITDKKKTEQNGNKSNSSLNSSEK